jgi:hypothetical protein
MLFGYSDEATGWTAEEWGVLFSARGRYDFSTEPRPALGPMQLVAFPQRKRDGLETSLSSTFSAEDTNELYTHTHTSLPEYVTMARSLTYRYLCAYLVL